MSLRFSGNCNQTLDRNFSLIQRAEKSTALLFSVTTPHQSLNENKTINLSEAHLD